MYKRGDTVPSTPAHDRKLLVPTHHAAPSGVDRSGRARVGACDQHGDAVGHAHADGERLAPGSRHDGVCVLAGRFVGPHGPGAVHLLHLDDSAGTERGEELLVAHVTRRESVKKGGTFEQWAAQ